MVPFIRAFWNGLAEFGYEEGKNMTLEARYAAGDLSKLPQLARELVDLRPDVILAPADVAAAELRKLTTTLPIVLVLGSDPVGAGLVKSLGRPGGNVTGLSVVGAELNAKRIELIKTALPKLARLGVLYRSDAFGQSQIAALRGPADAVAVKLVLHDVRSESELQRAIEAAARTSEALFVLPGPFMFTNRKRVIEIVRAQRIPAMYSENVFAQDGGLMAFSADFLDCFRRVAGYVHRILKGTKPEDLPIEEPTRFEFVVNLRTARELDLTFPKLLLLRVDRVIE
ncbi:MAG: ABC transporter substrate-binding protein [Betaproteobacteria bacterium]|nr:ABC transporter substrate-binding protein [Betaproteobacteria bacterium]